MNTYYIYFYLREDFTPYYVGKGKKNRAWNDRKGVQLPKDKSKIILIEQNLTELQAFILERYYIRWFGRKDIGKGILHNRTDGGEGVSGRIVSEETKQKISESNKGRSKKPKAKEILLKHSATMKLIWSGKNSKLRSAEAREKRSNAKIRNWKNDNYRKIKIDSINNLWRDENSLIYRKTTKTYKVFPPAELKIDPFIITNLSKFCRENGLTYQCMTHIASRNQGTHRGWRCEKII